MSKINVTPEEFGNIIIAFLLDKSLHPDEVIPGNEIFDKLMLRMYDKGLKPLALKAFLEMDSQDRVKYKRIKDSFTDGKANVINITQFKPVEIKGKEKPESKLSKIGKKILKRLVAGEELSSEEKEYLKEIMEE